MDYRVVSHVLFIILILGYPPIVKTKNIKPEFDVNFYFHLNCNQQEGFFLMVEGARIDHAHHDGFVNRALEETVGFEEALEAVIKSLEESNQLDEVKG
jgi:hypothetical protein